MNAKILHGLLLWFVAAAAVCAAPLEVKNVRVWVAPDNTRIVLDINRPTEYSHFRLPDPERLVIDIPDTRLFKPSLPERPQDKYLRRIRTGKRGEGNVRMVLDLKQSVKVRVFQLKPNRHYDHRLVIDLLQEETVREEKKPVVADQGADQGGTARLKDVVIAIDPGHGGEDPGAIGKHGTYEKHVVLSIAKKLAREINRRKGMKAMLTREGDYFLKLRKRIEIARRYEADLFVSLHADAFRDPRVRGSSVYVLSQKGASSEMARWLADRENNTELIGGVEREAKDDVLWGVLLDLSQANSLEQSINVADRVLQGLMGIGKVHRPEVQSAGFAVLKSPDIPSILIETAFISNPLEEKRLLDQNYQNRLVRAITDSLHGYFLEYAREGTWLAKQGKRQYTIRRGDTLSEIAARYNVSVDLLRQHNQLKNDMVRVGQSLSIPVTDKDI